MSSLVEYYGMNEGRCGYCKRSPSKGRICDDMTGHSLIANDYQDLLDRNWRRSGTHCYRPLNKLSCCPNYAIICSANKFKLTKSKRKCIQKMNNFLLNGDICDTSGKIIYAQQHLISDDNKQIQETKISTSLNQFDKLRNSSKSRDRRFVTSCQRLVDKQNLNLEKAIRQVVERKYFKHNTRHERFASLEDHLYPKKSLNPTIAAKEPSHKLELRLHHVQSAACRGLRAEQVELMQKYQIAVHEEEQSDWTEDRFCSFLVDTPLGIEKISGFDYSEGDTVNDDNHVWSPTNATSESDHLLIEPPALPTCYGTYHCSYLLDGKLIALAVLDMLPRCLTTVYFLYDTALKSLNLGIYSALIEISLTRAISKRQLERSTARLDTYHLGFYVPECEKMRYKTRFKPSYLLCSDTNQFVETEICLRKLRDSKHSRFSDSGLTEDEDLAAHVDIEPETLLDFPVFIGLIGAQPEHEPSLSGITTLLDYIGWIRANTHWVGPRAETLVESIGIRYVKKVGYPLSRRLQLRINAIHRAITIQRLRELR